MSCCRGNWPWWRCVLLGLSAAGAALSAYLSWHQLMGEALVGCGGGGSCDALLSSRWSTIAGVAPVSGLATGTYLSILVAVLFAAPSAPAPVRRLAWGAMLILSAAAAGSAVWFTVVQAWLVGEYCPYCVATHVIGVVLAALVVWRAPSTRRFALALVVAGFGLAGVLATSQVMFAPPVVTGSGTAAKVADDIDPRAVPLIGSQDAPNVVACLFDYQCSHCQQLHFMLEEAVRRFDGKLAFAIYPTPLNTACNPYVPRDVDQFKDSCELARVGLAVWKAKPEAFPNFQRWMFSYESGDRWRPRTLDAATSKAVELVGQEPFDIALHDGAIDRLMETSLRIYGAAGGQAIPVLVFGSRWVNPNPQDADDLVSILEDALGVPKP